MDMMFRTRKDVHDLNLRELNEEQLTEESLINLAYAILEEKHQPLSFTEIMQAIVDLGARSEAEMKAASAQFYTDMNIDGRFIALGENRWGVREWYAIDQVEEETAPTVRVRKKKAKVVEEDDLDDDAEEIEFEEDFDEFLDEDEAEEEAVEEETFDAGDLEDIDEEELEEDIDMDDEEFELDEDEDDDDEDELEEKERD
ncbi:DNA-directed RNA polymerase subunit delta [Rummeliibacillus sp. TYF-LIM-RU47]|uniref:DNA-directed RNA polymerase subunit delta n=1 Tax=unclassified Rummeliibacillus TaxID=2622809 RepID=UPI001CC24036|nr:DNA-directed RNA polymerase subunit delta [Rummeliibacillus sp. TYF-LIM-RU47]